MQQRTKRNPDQAGQQSVVPQYITKDKSLFFEMLKRTSVTSVQGRIVTAKDHFQDMVKKNSQGTKTNMLPLLLETHPLFWVTHLIGPWEDDTSIADPVSSLSKIQDDWFDICRKHRIYNQGIGMSQYTWDDFKRKWIELRNRPEFADAGKALEYLKTPDAALKKESDGEVWTRKVREAQEEGRRRLEAERVERNKRIKGVLENMMYDHPKFTDDEKLKGIDYIEKLQIPDELQMTESEYIEQQIAQARTFAEAKPITSKNKNMKKSEKKPRKPYSPEYKKVLLENLAKAREARLSKKAKEKDEKQLFVKDAVSPEFDSRLFVHTETPDFIKPKTRDPEGYEVKLDPETGTFVFGKGIASAVASKDLRFMQIVSTVNDVIYFTFSKDNGIETRERNGFAEINHETGVKQMIQRVGYSENLDEPVYLWLTNNVSYIPSKLAFKVGSAISASEESK